MSSSFKFQPGDRVILNCPYTWHPEGCKGTVKTTYFNRANSKPLVSTVLDNGSTIDCFEYRLDLLDPDHIHGLKHRAKLAWARHDHPI